MSTEKAHFAGMVWYLQGEGWKKKCNLVFSLETYAKKKKKPIEDE